MKKLSVWMSLSGAVMALTGMKDAIQSLTQLHVIFYALLTAGYISLLVFEILDSEERTKEKILNDVKVLNLKSGDKIIFKFDKERTRKKDIEKASELLDEVFAGHDILAISSEVDLKQQHTREGTKDNEEDTTAGR